MIVQDTYLEEVKVIMPKKIYRDDRGYFFESYKSKNFRENNLPTNFLQENQVRSKKNVIRGMHYQLKNPQGKLVKAIEGSIFDVAIDLRPSSKTYKKYVSIILDDKNKEQLFIPKGFGHAFLTLSDSAIISYKVDNFYNQDADGGIKYDDPSINISWELNKNQIILSDKDNKLPYL